MATLYEQLKPLIHTVFSGIPIASDNHLRIVRFEPDNTCLCMDIQDKHINHHGTLHGGYILLLADAAAGIAAITDGRNYVTQSQNFTFLRAVTGKVIYASGEVISRGRTVTVVRVQMKDENSKLLGDGSFTMFNIPAPIQPQA